MLPKRLLGWQHAAAGAGGRDGSEPAALDSQTPALALVPPTQCRAQVGDGTLRPAVPPGCHPLLADLLAACFDADPLNRPSFGLIVSAMSRVVQEVEAAAAERSLDSAWGRWFRPKPPPPAAPS